MCAYVIMCHVMVCLCMYLIVCVRERECVCVMLLMPASECICVRLFVLVHAFYLEIGGGGGVYVTLC